VPDHVKAKLNNPSKGIDQEKTEIDKLPKPVGWRILVLPFKAKETASVAMVLAVGDDAYADKEKFPNGPWCKQGDWVVFGRYAGSRIRIDGGEVRLLNDDEILGTVDNPEDILTIL
jgi:co-chaperonin GroES (HSP10)